MRISQLFFITDSVMKNSCEMRIFFAVLWGVSSIFRQVAEC